LIVAHLINVDFITVAMNVNVGTPITPLSIGISNNSVPDNCIILKGGVLECRDSLTQSISFSNQTGG
jgi:hypothetical protein